MVCLRVVYDINRSVGRGYGYEGDYWGFDLPGCQGFGDGSRITAARLQAVWVSLTFCYSEAWSSCATKVQGQGQGTKGSEE